MSPPSLSHSGRSALPPLCLLLLFFLAAATLMPTPAYASLHTTSGEDKLPGCGHDHVAAEHNNEPLSYVRMGTVEAPPTPSTPPPPSPQMQQPHIIEVQAAASSSGGTTWAPIRIAVFTPDLDDATKYCTAVGQSRPDSYGNFIPCATTQDILTDAKKSVLMNFVLPEAVKAHAARLMVRPVASGSTIVVSSMPGRYCGSFSVPDAHRTTGVADADFVVYVAAGPTSTPTSFIAWALTCQYFPNEVRHPAVGVIYFNPRYLPESVDETDAELTLYGGHAFGSANSLRRTAIHELLHALGFTSGVFSARGMLARVPSLRGKTNVPVLNGTAVRAAATAHFGLSSTDLFYGLELEDEGASGTTLSHWKRRTSKDELMAAVLNLARYSTMSIAAMEDLGFYKGIYTAAEPLAYGSGAGITAFNEPCLTSGTSNTPSLFCDSTNGNVHACSADRLQVGRCYLTYYSASLPSYEQYFANQPTYGGALPYMDYCPVIQPLSNAACNTGSASVIPGSVTSDSARCFDAANLIVKTTYATANAICANVHCDSTTGTYEVLVSGASAWLSCGTGGTGYSVSPASVSSNVYFVGGTIGCPPYAHVCYANPGAFAEKPSLNPITSAPTTTTTAKPSAATRVGVPAWVVAGVLAALYICTGSF